MTPKEMAEELKWEYLPLIEGWTSKDKSTLAKKLAKIGVNHLIECLPSVNGRPPNYQKVDKYSKEYWEKVNEELNLI